jgi:hypothetical protein
VSAPLKSRISPFAPDLSTNYSGDIYKGVFLNQSGPPSWTQPYYQVSFPSNQYISINGVNQNIYFQNWTVNGGAYVQNTSNNPSPVMFTSTNGSVIANVKATQVSSITSSYSSNSQRKVFSTYSSPECLFQVYESAGSIWMEKSTDGGTSWALYPTTPLFSSSSTTPSIDHYNNTVQDYIFATCLSGSNINGCIISSNTSNTRTNFNVDVNAVSNPVVSFYKNNQVMFLWNGSDGNGQDGLVYKTGTFSNNPLGITWNFDDPILITGTNSNSVNPSIEAIKTDNYLRLAWEENNTIKYRNLLVNTDNSITPQTITTISNYSGFSTNTKPSIIAVTGGARLTWVGRRTGYMGIVEQKAVFMDPSNTSLVWSFGTNVQNTAINLSPECYSIAWSSSNTDPLQFTDSHTLSTITTLTNLTGKDVQLSNGNHDYLMRAVSFNSGSAPYYFSNKNLYTQAKQNSVYNAINNGREGIVRKDDCQFYFAVGDVVADNRISEFIPVTDSTRLQSLDDLNNYLVTNPIQVNDNSQLAYSVEYGISDSVSASNALKGSSAINFKVEILDAATDEVLGTSDNVTYDSLHVFNYDNISYQVNMEGIGNKTIKLRLKVSANSDVEYSLKSSYATENVLLKRQVKNTVVTLHTKVNSYDLSQNYPNPFNPATTIKYQIPKAGMVTLKVYDILGNEVESLVNEFKNEGRYNVNFDASKLASGVYIYQIKSSDYMSSKKMVLIK